MTGYGIKRFLCHCLFLNMTCCSKENDQWSPLTFNVPDGTLNIMVSEADTTCAEAKKVCRELDLHSNLLTADNLHLADTKGINTPFFLGMTGKSRSHNPYEVMIDPSKGIWKSDSPAQDKSWVGTSFWKGFNIIHEDVCDSVNKHGKIFQFSQCSLASYSACQYKIMNHESPDSCVYFDEHTSKLISISETNFVHSWEEAKTFCNSKSWHMLGFKNYHDFNRFYYHQACHLLREKLGNYFVLPMGLHTIKNNTWVLENSDDPFWANWYNSSNKKDGYSENMGTVMDASGKWHVIPQNTENIFKATACEKKLTEPSFKCYTFQDDTDSNSVWLTCVSLTSVGGNSFDCGTIRNAFIDNTDSIQLHEIRHSAEMKFINQTVQAFCDEHHCTNTDRINVEKWHQHELMRSLKYRQRRPLKKTEYCAMYWGQNNISIIDSNVPVPVFLPCERIEPSSNNEKNQVEQTKRNTEKAENTMPDLRTYLAIIIFLLVVLVVLGILAAIGLIFKCRYFRGIIGNDYATVPQAIESTENAHDVQHDNQSLTVREEEESNQ